MPNDHDTQQSEEERHLSGETLEEANRRLAGAVGELGREVVDLQAKARNLGQGYDELLAQFHSNNALIEALKGSNAQKDTKIAEQASEIAQLKEHIAHQQNAMRLGGAPEHTRPDGSSNNPSEFLEESTQFTTLGSSRPLAPYTPG